MKRQLVVMLASLCLVLPVRGQTYQRIEQADLHQALLQEQQKGYSLTATTNGARLWTHVIMALVRDAQAHDPDGSPLYIDQADYFAAYLRVTGLEPSTAPVFLQLANEFRQNTLVEYRRSKIIDTTGTDPLPQLALGIKTWWADTTGLPSQ